MASQIPDINEYKMLNGDQASAFWQPLSGGRRSNLQGAVDVPTTWDLIESYEDIVFAVISLVASHCSIFQPNLYVSTNNKQSFPKCPSRPLTRKNKDSLEKNYTRYVRKSRDTREVVDYPLLDIIDKPNPFNNWQQFFYLATGFYLITGSTIIEKVENTIGQTAELYILPTQNITIDDDTDDGTIKNYIYDNGNERREIDPEKIIHWKQFNPIDPYNTFGKGALEASWKKIQLLRMEIQAWTAVLNNASQPNLVVTPPPGDEWADPQIDRISKQLMERFRWGNEGGPWILPSPLTISNISPKPSDMKAIQISEQIKRSVCSAFHVPLALIDMPEDSMAQNSVRRAFQLDCLKPTITSFCEVLTQSLCHDDRLFFAVPDIVERDYAFSLQKYSAMFQSNCITVNEYRESQGLEPDTKNGNKYLYELIGTTSSSGTMGTLPSFNTEKALDKKKKSNFFTTE